MLLLSTIKLKEGSKLLKKILFVLAILILTFQSAFAVDFPAVGYCTGNSVRLRDNPGTEDTEILGRVDKGQRLILRDEVYIDSERWFEADNPFDEGTVWIFGKYVDVHEYEDVQE